jgi:ABC-type lipoprotein export system ATPase subunit
VSREAAIDLRDVFRIYQTGEGDAAALQGLTLRVEPGEHVAVLGPSGSGKSTLLRILAALETPSAGSARVLGRDIGRLSGRQAAELRASELGLVDQHYDRALPPDLSALETIALQLAMRGAGRAERERRARELLERVGLASAADARPGELSGGEQQRVALCAAIAHRPRLLLADEPAGELDEASVVVIYDLIGELARETGTTVVLVSHDPAASSRADRALRIRDGRLSGERAPQLGGDEALVVGYGGWVRLPDELLRDAGITSHARASLDPQGIVVRSAAPPAVGEPARAEPEPELPQPAPAGIVAELRGVDLTYGTGHRARAVLESFDAAFERGLLTAVTGRSGSGKSTLLRLLAGLERPDAGEVVVLGRSLATLDRPGLAAFRRDHLALVGQDAGLVGFQSATENVAFGLTLRGFDEEQAMERARRWLGRLGLGHRLEMRVGRLSAGERQRVAIARALAPEPDLLLVDEPTSRLDLANAEAVAQLLSEAALLYGATIVCATHEPVLVEHAHRELPLGAPLSSAA